MTFEDFNQSLQAETPPASLSAYAKALWYDGKGEWDKAHNIIQETEDKTASWIHAYLHRKEGDTGNADYWYHRAGRKRPAVSLQEEWQSIVKELL